MSILFVTVAAPIVASAVVTAALVWMSRTSPRYVPARQAPAVTTLEAEASRAADLDHERAA